MQQAYEPNFLSLIAFTFFRHTAFLNDTFGSSAGTYFSATSILIGFLSLFSVDIHRKLNRKHADGCLQTTTGKQQHSPKLWTVRSADGGHHGKHHPSPANVASVFTAKDEQPAVGGLMEPGKQLSATARMLKNKRKLFYSQTNDETMKKFLNGRQVPSSDQQTKLTQRNHSFPQLAGDCEEEKDNFLPLVLTPNLFASYPTTNHYNYIFGSRHSLDTLLNKIHAPPPANCGGGGGGNQLANFASLPEFTNLLTNLKYSEFRSDVPVTSSSIAARTTNKAQPANYLDFGKSPDKVIYLNKQPNRPLELSERRNSNISIRKLSEPQIDGLLESGDRTPKGDRSSNRKDQNSSSESSSDSDSDIEEIDVDCNQIKNDKQVLEDLNELINESLNNENLNNLDKFFARCSQSSSDEEEEANSKTHPKEQNSFRSAHPSKHSKPNQSLIANLGLEPMKEKLIKGRSKLKSDGDELFTGQLICDDYEHLVQSLLQSKQKEKHHTDCVMSKLIQEILKQITIKSLSDEFNPASPCHSPNLVQLQADLNRLDLEFDRHFDKRPEKHCEERLDSLFDPSVKLKFLKENLLKCANCDKLMD